MYRRWGKSRWHSREKKGKRATPIEAQELTRAKESGNAQVSPALPAPRGSSYALSWARCGGGRQFSKRGERGEWPEKRLKAAMDRVLPPLYSGADSGGDRQVRKKVEKWRNDKGPGDGYRTPPGQLPAGRPVPLLWRRLGVRVQT